MRGTRFPAWSAVLLGIIAVAVSACSRTGGTGPEILPYAAPAPIAAPQIGPDLHDRGPRTTTRPVNVTIVLRLNRRVELDKLLGQISRPSSPRYHRFISPREFAERFAPTAAQTRFITKTLQRAGFTIVQTYPSGTLIRARAATAIVERYFHTKIHDFDQGLYGPRYSNVTRLRIPRAIAPLVLGVELNNVVYAHAGPIRLPSAPSSEIARSTQLQPESANAVRNPGFESGTLKPWYACGDATPPEAAISKLHPHSGTFDAIAGSPTNKSAEPNGTTGVCQNVTIPPSAVLTAYLYQRTDDVGPKGAKQIVALLSPKGKQIALLLNVQRNKTRWIAYTSPSLASYAGKTLALFFGVRGFGKTNRYVTQFVDDVQLVSSSTPSPSPSPSVSTTPSAIPAGPGSPIAGPTYGPDSFTPAAPYDTVQRGWGPLAVANGFDLPVQHGYDGTGVTAAVVIDGTINPSDLANYTTEYDVHQTGTITTVPIASATPYGNDPLETSLDVETITGLAPGANIAIYDMPDLTNQSMETAYQQILSDAGTTGKPHASVVNTSIDECETEDATFDAAVDQDAVQGAAIGITFVAASGDWGSTCYYGYSHPLGVNVPAAAPHVLAVGGNQSYSSTGIANPVAWQNCNAGFNANYCASGGGVSTVFTPLPSYQSGIAGVASATSRNVPDIAFPAVLDDIYYNTGYGPHGLIVGTSWASPIAVALLTEAVQICGPAGWVNPAIYSIYSTYGESPYFVDVTSGSNAGFMGYAKGYSATPGYDNVTGLGMPNGATFVAALCRVK
jgi:hypothetical protein